MPDKTNKLPVHQELSGKVHNKIFCQMKIHYSLKQSAFILEHLVCM